MGFFDWLFGGSATTQVASPEAMSLITPATTSPPDVPAMIRAAMGAAAPGADLTVWLGPLVETFNKHGLTTPYRVAAAIGQFSVEAGPSFAEIAENLNYTRPQRIMAVFPREFPTFTAAQACCGNPEKLANRAYAGKLGNGNEASGDGWRFRGRGLIQLTGRDEYAAFAASVGMPIDAAAAYLETPAGAAASGAWYFVWRHALPAMDLWDVDGVTRLVNGSAMEGAFERLAASEAALKAIGDLK
jgi:predicted chitinase